MQEEIEENLPPSSHSRSPSDSLDDGGAKKEIEDMVEENLVKQKNAFISSNDDKKEADGDIVMKDVTQDAEKRVATACIDRGMAVEKNKGKEQAVDPAGSDLSGDKGDVKQENHGSDEWQFVLDSDGTHKSHQEDEMSYKVSVAGSSDEEFSFGSKEDEDAIRDDALMIKPFNMDLLRDCIARGEESLCEIEGKDVVLVVGKTGTGKSTFIQGIAGKTFKKASYLFECQGWSKKVRKDVFDAENAICGFEIGHAKSSMTKHIRCYLRHCSTEDNERGIKSTKAPSMMYYLDTPGFEDTDGEEVDIATSAMLGQVAKKCRSIRFVVMINYVSLLEDRGGAMRSILKFMRNFVDDFDANKRSFLFLFSHADEIKDIPESLEGAKRSLLNEILLTIDGNGDAKDLLSFIKKCLTKGYSFVDVFHPLKTDFSKITKFIEHKLKPIKCNEPGKYRKNAGLTSSSFTTSSKLRLMGAVQKQLGDLRILLRRNPVVIEKVREIQQAFRFFDKYIQFGEMRKAVGECEELIIEHVKCLRGVVEEEVRKGSTMFSDTVFNEVNIARLKDAILQLQVIDSETFNVQVECNRITRDLNKFQDALLRETDGSTNKMVDFYGFSENLRKLNAWSILDPGYSVFFDSVVDHTNAIVKRVTDDAYNIQMSVVCSPSTTADEMQELTSALSTLKSIKENMRGLSYYLSGVSGASAAFDDFTNRLKSHVEALGEIHSTDSKKEEFDFGNKQYVEDLTTRIRSLDVVSELINAVKLQDDVSSLVRSVKEVIEYQTVDNYSSACLQFEESSRHKFNGACKGLTILRDAMSIFSSIEESRWKKIECSYKTQVERIKSLLKIKSGQLNEMTQYTLQYGLQDAERLGKAASDFETCQWFDEFLPEGERFVRDSLVKINDDLRRRFTAKFGSINNMFINSVADATIIECQQDSMKIITTLRNALPEISEYALYASVVGNGELTNHIAQIFSTVKDFTKSRAICWQNDLNVWVQLTSNENNDLGKLNSFTEKLNFAIWEINELSALSSERCTADIVSLSQPILDDIIARFSDLKQQVQDSVKSEMTYEEFTALLARVEALEAFPHTARHLPSLEQLKQVASERVSCDVKIIEDMIEQSADFDKIDKQIKEFEQAVLLDKFVSHEASNRLRSLKIFLAGKESDVDGMITKMIDTNDFSGLREFLQHLIQSKNQIRQTKFRKSVGRIAESFKCFEDTLRNEIDGKLMTRDKGIKIASCLKILEEIIHEAGDYLEPASSTSSTIEFRLNNYKKQLNSRLCELQDRMSFAIDKADFLALAKHHHQTTIFSDLLGQYLTEFSREKIETNTTKLCDLKGSIPSSIEAFVRSSFAESREIEMILTGLKSTLTTEDPFFSDLSQLYIDNTNFLTKQVKGVVQTLKHATEDTLCYDDSIAIIRNLLRSIHSGLKGHLSDEVLDQAKMLSITWIEARENEQFDMEFEGKPIDLVIRAWAERLEKSAPSSNIWSSFPKLFTRNSTSQTYDRLQRLLKEKSKEKYDIGRQALQMREFAPLTKSFEFLNLVVSMTKKHVPSALDDLRMLEREAVKSFQSLCGQFRHAIQSRNYRDFESFFSEFRGFVLNVTCLTKDHYAFMSFHRTNQLVYEHFCEQISSVDKALNGIEFRTMKQKVEDTRIFGGHVADWYSLLYEELKEYPQIYHDKWLKMLKNEIHKHFQNGRDLKRIKLYAVIGVVPSASKDEINRAFRRKSRTCHPDKCKDQGHAKEWEEKFKMLQNARDELNEHFSLNEEHLKKPFDDDIRDLGHRLRELTKRALTEQHYARVSNLLFNMFGIELMDSLVSPKLETEKIRDDVIRLVEHHFQKVRTEADSNWSERKYQSLNFNIKDLKMMQLELCSHPNVFPASWNRGIIEKVEGEIDNLGEQARTFLRDKKVADANIDQFRRLFTQMGAVLVELPDFKDFTKGVMSNILDSCLDWDWGYVFLFKLGLSLRGGSDTESEDNAHLTQNLLSEFSHFKDVLTMVWNEETIQKPPEVTVGKICGEYIKSASINAHSTSFTSLGIDTEELLNYFFEFDSLYKSFLGDYLNPEDDVKVLVRKTIDRCEPLKSLSCDDGFSAETKSVLPTIIAGICAVFTILKSGESFNRLEEDATNCNVDAKQLLMKPHNIQILTLLCMFGCGTKRSSSLKSQLMQVRTGEGKSIILGAAATVLGLLGFRVRCICYSEYLSNRDYKLFFEVFDLFGLSESVKYSSIKTYSGNTIQRKGDIRVLTESLLRGELATSSATKTLWRKKEEYREEILLIDEVDVFFGSDFYGKTYNPAVALKEPEITKILKRIWDGRKEGQNKPNLNVIKAMPEYQSLKQKFPGYDYLLKLEVTKMLSDVCHFNSPPYFLNRGTDKIGYKENDGVSYDTSYGYRTVFAYMQEADAGNLKDPDGRLSAEMALNIYCGKFSFANIKPKRILGVSGTLDALDNYEKGVLEKYGVCQYLYIPSVYETSNLTFDKAGDGISIEKSVDDFFQKITKEINKVATTEKRAVIVFFKNKNWLDEYTSSAFYRKLGRKKEILHEATSTVEKPFVISKAASSGQVTLCSSAFGRGTDFFCKDDKLERNGGVQVVQAFFSAHKSEEIQIQGRTARQGKQGSYKLILLDKDLEEDFNIERSSIDGWPKAELYEKLCDARNRSLEEEHDVIEKRLLEATKVDKITHDYFNALLEADASLAKELLKRFYLEHS